MNTNGRNLNQIKAELLISVFGGLALGMTIVGSVNIIHGMFNSDYGDIFIVLSVLFITYLFSSWCGIRYLSSEWRLNFLRLLAGSDTLVANAVMGPNYGLIVTSGKDLIITNSTFYNSKDDIAAVYVEGNSNAQVSDTTFIGVR